MLARLSTPLARLLRAGLFSFGTPSTTVSAFPTQSRVAFPFEAPDLPAPGSGVVVDGKEPRSGAPSWVGPVVCGGPVAHSVLGFRIGPSSQMLHGCLKGYLFYRLSRVDGGTKRTLARGQRSLRTQIAAKDRFGDTTRRGVALVFQRPITGAACSRKLLPASE